MKVVKPLKLGILHRTFEYRGRCFWSPAVMVFFSYDGSTVLLPEADMWTFCGEELGLTGVLDQGMPKQNAEVLLSGAFFAPDGQPVPAGRVRIRLGPLDKELYVYGQRYWKRNLKLVWDITAPEPMTNMPITYANAFGGPAYKFNPLGKGLSVEGQDAGGVLQPLPNVENPSSLIGARRDRPQPAGFGPLDMTWPQRHTKCGTYDDKWYQERFPGLADDIDWRFFNTAPEDQQIEGFFQGGEAFFIEGMHPSQRMVQGWLPALRPRCCITRNDTEEDAFREIGLNLDTVWLFPHALKGVLIYHGLHEVPSDNAKQIDHLLIAYEMQKDPPRSLKHYREALARRLDREKGALRLLDESDLIGNDERSGFAEMMASETMAELKGDGLFQKKRQRQMERDVLAVRAMIADQGLDPDQMLPMPVQNQRDTESLDFDHILVEVQQQRQEADEKLEKQLKSQGLTKAQMLSKAATEPSPRPTFSADQAIAAFRALGIEDPDLEGKMRLVETSFYGSYRQGGHAMPPVLAVSPQQHSQKKKLLLEAFHAGEPPPDPDLAGLDLSGLNLEGIDLKGVFLEDANLAGACLRNANLENSALMRTDFSAADLTAANLKGAGLGKADLRQTNLTGATLTGASLVAADLCDALLREANLNQSDLSETKGHKADFSRARLIEARFLEADLPQALFVDAALNQVLFMKTNLSGADFSHAVLTEAVLVQAAADGCLFRGADLSNLRAAFQCTFTGTDFSGAALTKCNFRGSDLSGACFSGADISGADFSETRLTACNLSRIKAKQALFIEADLTDADLRAANLFESLLHNATLVGTRFIGANLYGVDFKKALFKNTDITLAQLAKSTLKRWAPR